MDEQLWGTLIAICSIPFLEHDDLYWKPPGSTGKPPIFDPVAMGVLFHGCWVCALACAGSGGAPTGARQRAANIAGARYPCEECGLASLYSRRPPAPRSCASNREANSSRFKCSSRTRLLKDSTYAFSHGLPGAIYNGRIACAFSHASRPASAAPSPSASSEKTSADSCITFFGTRGRVLQFPVK